MLMVGSGGRFSLGSRSCCLMVFPPFRAVKPEAGESSGSPPGQSRTWLCLRGFGLEPCFGKGQKGAMPTVEEGSISVPQERQDDAVPGTDLIVSVRS